MFFFSSIGRGHMLRAYVGEGPKWVLSTTLGGRGDFSFFWERGVGFVILKLKNYNNSALCAQERAPFMCNTPVYLKVPRGNPYV